MIDALYLLLLFEVLLLVAVTVSAICFVVWFFRESLLNAPALLREAIRPRLHYQQRIQITGGFYASYTGRLKSRDGTRYQIEIDGVGEEKIAIRYLRPLLPPALPSSKETGEECRAEYPKLIPTSTWLREE